MRLSLLIILFLSSLVLHSQNVEDVFIGLKAPSGLDIHDHILYVSQEDAKSVSKVDLSATSGVMEELITLSGNGNPFIMVQDGTYLYYSNFKEGHIAKIKMGVVEPESEMVLENLSKPAGLLIKDNILYFGHDSNKISKVNLNDPSLAIIDITSGLAFPTNLALSGKYLFVAEFNGNKISKIDLSLPVPVPVDFLTGLKNPGQFALHANELFYGEFSNGKISKVDINATTPTAVLVADQLQQPTGLAIDGNTLYFCQLGAGKISKIEGAIGHKKTMN